MVRDWYDQIARREETRGALIALKAEIKEKDALRALQDCFDKEPETLISCLGDEDPKVRKNAALVLGCIKGEQIPEALWKAYETENQLFVKSDYLKALSSFSCENYLEELNARKRSLEAQLKSLTDESEGKHLKQELMELRKLLFHQEKHSGHSFVGRKQPVDVLLLTNKGCEKLLLNEIRLALPETEEETLLHPVKGGVLVEHGKVEYLTGIRTYREMLFCLKSSKKMTAETAAALLWEGDLMAILKKLHEGEGPYYFRVDVKGKMGLPEKSAFCKRIALDLETISGGTLQNAPSAYELEIRFVENREGTYYPLLKLFTLPDKRFSYRKHTVAASMAPVQAAIAMELAKDYLKEDAQVLDPFCGVGTMLLERNYKLHANTLYGIDLYAPAVEGARANAEIAGVPAHFINRDSRTFTHKYKFDEIVTNFPVQGKSINAHDLDCLYGQFLDRAEDLLKPEGIILLYSHDRGYAKKHVRMNPAWRIEKEWCISEKEGAYLFCIKRAF